MRRAAGRPSVGRARPRERSGCHDHRPPGLAARERATGQGGSSPARTAEDFPAPLGPETTSSRASTSRADQARDQPLPLPRKSSASSAW